MLYSYQRVIYKMYLFFDKLLCALTNCPDSVFPTCSGCVNATRKFRQGKPLHDPCCQKPEVSDAEWHKGVMQEADFLLGNDK